MRQPPEDVRIGLENVRSTLRVIWNPTAVQLPTVYDAAGKARDCGCIEDTATHRMMIWLSTLPIGAGLRRHDPAGHGRS